MILRFLVQFWMRPLAMGFFGIGMGVSPGEKQQYNLTAGLANFGTSEGEADINAADSFWRSILSGDPGQISKVLGPEFSAINKQGQERKLTTAEFGNRSGGTNAAMQTLDDSTTGQINQLLGSLPGTAAGHLGSTGSGLLSLGLSGHEAAFGQQKVMHDQNEARVNDIFKSIAEVAGNVIAPGVGGVIASQAFS